MKYLDHKEYTGSIEYSKEDKLLYGKVLGIQGLLSYEGKTGVELEAGFISIIDEYLTHCQETAISPEKPFKGSFNVRISSELHRELALKAMELNSSQNQLVREAIRSYLLSLSTNSPKLSLTSNS